MTADEIEVRGPYFEELIVGQVFDTAPALTLTSGLAATHQSIVGDRLRLPLSEPLARAVTGRAPIAHPALVWNVAIGQSTLVTQHVRANLFYRGLALRRLPVIGDTLHTVTTVVELKQNRVKPGRPATGLAVLHQATTDQEERPVLDFYRCAMIPLGDAKVDTRSLGDLTISAADLPRDVLLASIQGWEPPPSLTPLPKVGRRLRVSSADVVSNAPELARLTLNIAAVHHDAGAAGGRRLVFGGHTIALALAQATRAIPGLLTVLGWHACEHLAPVHEGDQLSSTIDVQGSEEWEGWGRILQLRSRVSCRDVESGDETPVLDWRFVALAC
ncbi:MAG: Acyl dehydratase-like protein [Mycobacterium sp.]|nr:Acyl dehydratase-like protein [Mycobacterium sp.]